MGRILLPAAVLVAGGMAAPAAGAQWLEVRDLRVTREETEVAGPRLGIEYEIPGPSLSPASPAWVFLRYTRDGGRTWHFLPSAAVQGEGLGIVESPGRKRIVCWGIEHLGLADLEAASFRVRAIPMVRVPAGRFTVKTVPGGGHDQTRSPLETADLPTFYLARCETTVQMYADYLNEAARGAGGWNPRMASAEKCGIEKTPDGSFRVLPGRAPYPVVYVSWYHAVAFLEWCGLRLPTELEMLKATRGGHFLDGDAHRKVPNPLPERKYPWGNEAPDEGGIFRCNFDGDQDGFPHTAPVGSFAKFASPYGALDLAGNVAEWTADRYATTFHTGLDGYRILRGGSWMDPPEGCDAVTAPTSLPIRESAIVGFRGALDGR